MKNYTGLAKELILLNNLRYKELRKLPLSILWHLHRSFRNEKISRHGRQFVISTFMPPFPSRAFEQFIANAAGVYRRKLTPYSAYLALTNRCGFNCWHCSRSFRAQEELSARKWIEAIAKLQGLGVSVIGFTGGEPLYRDDLEEIIRSVDSRSTPILFTSGDGLSQERAKGLKDAGLFYLVVSLDHYDSKQYNKLRGSQRAFDIALEAIQNSTRSGLYTATQLVARKEAANKEFIYKYAQFVKALGVAEIRVVEPMPTGKLICEGKDVFLEEDERRSLKKAHMEVNKMRSLPKVSAFAYLEDAELYGCGAWLQHVYIDASGNLCPCDFTPLSFGNIAREDFLVCMKRLKNNFSRPRDTCFILENIERLKPYFKGSLPIGHEDSERICQECPQARLPTYYKKLGWK